MGAIVETLDYESIDLMSGHTFFFLFALISLTYSMFSDAMFL